MDSLFLPDLDAYLRYHDRPGGSPICVYLTGLGMAAAASYLPLISRPGLAGTCAVLVDYLGFGYSDRPAGFTYTLADHAATVATLLDHLELRGCTLFGWSLGGSVAITLAAARPDLVARLVVAEANLDAGGGGLSRSIADQGEEHFVAEGFVALLARYGALARAGNRLPSLAYGQFQIAAPHAFYRTAAGLVAGTQPSMRDHLRQLPIPRWYIFGAHSLPDPDWDALPQDGVRVAAVPDAGHGMLWENPAGVAAILQEALGA